MIQKSLLVTYREDPKKLTRGIRMNFLTVGMSGGVLIGLFGGICTQVIVKGLVNKFGDQPDEPDFVVWGDALGDVLAIGSGGVLASVFLTLGLSSLLVNGVYRDLLIDQGAEYDWEQEKRIKYFLLGAPIGAAVGVIFGLMSLFN